jgi:L-ascorbate metabolism protein UlaG (beta-lactamase superfamily)
VSRGPSIGVTWLGHSTALVDIGGVRVLTDPVLTSAVAHLRRHHVVPTPEHVDVVAISHVHMDHLHPRSLRRVTDATTHVIVPAGAAPFLRRVGSGRVTEVRVGDVVELSGGEASERVVLEAVTAEHSDRRGPHTRRTAAALGYVVRAGGRTVYFAGDTGPFDGMEAFGPVDVALLPIWGWGSSLGEHHLDPVTAAEATARLAAGRVIPIHWGTYSPRRGRRGAPPWLDRPLEEFRLALAERGLADRLVALRPGDAVRLDG